VSSENIKKHWYVSKNNLDYVQDYKILNGLQNESETIRMIIKEHEEYKKKVFDLNYISEAIKHELLKSVSNVISETILEELRRVRLGTNNTDRNTQILLELLQGWMYMSNVQAITTTNDFKPDFFVFAESIVQNRIIHQKQKKDTKIGEQK
jgi:hypothetical protein